MPTGGAAAAGFAARLTKLTPLWLVRGDQKREEYLPNATLIAPDASRSLLLADDSAVLYEADWLAHAAPLTRQPRPDADAAYRKLLQKIAVSNAKHVGLALYGYAQDNDERFPDSNNLAATLAACIGDPSIFKNRETGTPAFALMLSGQGLSQIRDLANTVLGYLAGPGGLAILMADGQFHWEDTP